MRPNGSNHLLLSRLSVSYLSLGWKRDRIEVMQVSKAGKKNSKEKNTVENNYLKLSFMVYYL